MSDSRQMKFNLLMDLQQAIRNVNEFNIALDKIKTKKLTGNIGDQLKTEIASAKNIVNEEGQQINKILNNIGNGSNQGITKYVQGYKSSINSMVQDIEKYNRLFKETGNIEYQNKVNTLIPQVRQLSNEYNSLNKSIGLNVKNTGLLDNAFTNIKSHASWLASSALIGGAIAVPGLAVYSIVEIEKQMAGMKQVIPELHDSQTALNKATMDFIGIASQYGLSMNDITESAKLWGRAYKDINEVQALLHSSSILAIADNFSMTEANKSLEAVMMQYGIRARNAAEAQQFSMKIVDSWTNVAHNAVVSAQDLAAANERSASAAYQAGVSFDFLQGMIATMSRNTGRAGGELGNAIRSFLVSIHSDKAINEIEKLGVAMYDVAADGTKSFRDVEKVILDLMVTSQATEKDIQKLMLSASGGKFQYNKVAALIGDYNELIRTIELSINSQGVAKNQAEMQIDTLARKLERLKTEMQGVVMGAGNSGLTAWLKGVVDSINVFIARLQTIPESSWKVVGTTMEIAISLKLAASAYTVASTAITAYKLSSQQLITTKAAQSAANITEASTQGAVNIVNGQGTTISRVSTVAKQAETAVTVELTLAERALAIARGVATGGLSVLIGAMITGVAAYTLFNTQSEESIKNTKNLQTQEEKLTAQMNDRVASTESEINILSNKIKFIDDLKTAYPLLIEQMKKESEQSEKGIAIKEKIQTTEHALTSMLGEEAMARIKSSADIGQAINEEIAKLNQRKDSLLESLKVERQAIVDHSTITINKANDRLKAIEAETMGLATEAQKQIAIYESINAAKLSSLAWRAAEDQKSVESVTAQLTDVMKNGVTNANYKSYLDLQRQQETAVKLAGKSDKAYKDALAAEGQGEYAKKKQAIADIQAAGNPYIPGLNPGGGGTIEDGGKKKGRTPGTGAANPPDSSEEIFRLEKGREVDSMLQNAKVSADKYSSALDILNTKESIFGFSAANSAEKLGLMNKRILDLIADSINYAEQSQDYERQASDKIASNQTLVAVLDEQKVAWKDLTKEEKQAFIQRYKNYIQDEKSLLRLLDLSDKLKVASSDARKSASNIATDTAKLTYDVPNEEYRKGMQLTELDKNHAISLLGYDALESEREVVELKYAVKELYDAQVELNRISAVFGDTSIEYKQAQAEVDKLKNKVDQLNNTKTDKLKAQVGDMIVSWAVDGQSFQDIWKNVWKEFQKDAIYALMGIKNEGGFLSQVLGLFGGGTTKAAGLGSNVGSRTTSALMPSTTWAFADGGIVDKPTYGVFGEAGEEANINLAKLRNGDSRQQELLSYANSQWNKGESYVPTLRNPELAKTATMNVQVQQSAEHIAELTKHTKLLQDMMLFMLNDQGSRGSGGNTVVLSQVSDKQVMDAISRNPRAMQGIAAMHSNQGYRR